MRSRDLLLRRGFQPAISRRVLLVVSVGLTFAFRTLTARSVPWEPRGKGYKSSVKTRGEKRQTAEPERKVTNVTSGLLCELAESFAAFAVKGFYGDLQESQILSRQGRKASAKAAKMQKH